MRTSFLLAVVFAVALGAPLRLRAQDGPNLAGSWVGTLDVGVKLRLVFNVQATEDGGFAATLDSPDQGARGIPISAVIVDGSSVRFEVSAIAGTYAGTLDASANRLEGTWSQGGMSLPLSLERGDEPEAPKRPQEPKPPYPYRSEDVQFANGEAGITLAGTFTTPAGDGPFPAVALVTGSGPQDRNEELLEHKPFLVLADHLTRSGIAVLRYDDRGVGGSTGDFPSATSRDFASDALSAIAWLRTRPEVRPDGIGLVGHSEGGLVAPMAAIESTDIAFLVLLAAPGLDGRDIVLLQSTLIGRAEGVETTRLEANAKRQAAYFDIVENEPDTARASASLKALMTADLAAMSEAERTESGLTGGNTDALIDRQVAQVNSPWFRYFLSYDPLPALRKVTVPVLALNGTLDLQVPWQENLDAIVGALREAGNADVTALPLEGLNHLFQTATTGSPTEYGQIEETIAPQALDTISGWILERFGR